MNADDGASRNPVVLEIAGVSKHYHGREVLHHMSLTLHRGEVKVIVGPSGAGKSTLLRCLSLLEPVDEGAILLEGQHVGRVPNRDGGWRREPERELIKHRLQIGIVFQGFNLFPHLTALGNVMIGPSVVQRLPKPQVRDEAEQILARVGLADKLHSYPGELSGGQQQRVAIARTLVMRPKVLLLDEPTAALDAELVREVVDVMEGLARDGMTMLVVTHELAFAREAADTVIMLADGAFVEEAPPEIFFQRPAHERTRRFLQIIAD